MAIYLAPRSGEQSAENFKKTVEGGYRKSELASFLSDADKSALASREILYIWGNRPGGKGPWENMQIGDYIFFYQKGFITYTSKLLHKTHNKPLADSLWGIDESGQSWEYVFFADELTPVRIDYSLMKTLAGYKPNAVVQGFQSYNEVGLNNVIEQYGSVNNFIDLYRIDPTGNELSILEVISNKSEAETTPEDLVKIDEITKDVDLDLVISKLRERNKDIALERVEAVVTKLKRDTMAVKALKEMYKDKCQVCGIRIRKADGGYYCEVAHIVGLWQQGQDNISNMLVLCPNHHKMLDYGSMEIDIKTLEATVDDEKISLTNLHLNKSE
jgi:hypothetical protein